MYWLLVFAHFLTFYLYHYCWYVDSFLFVRMLLTLFYTSS
jgi:hypothetical protein